jgi:hypothetical protein
LRTIILKQPVFFWLLNAAIINVAVILFINKDYPMVGHDYYLAIPQMLDSAIHYRLTGPTVQWYTPSLGGGLPAFPNPNNSQFSLLEILPIWVNPWMAVTLSSIFFISLGYYACYLLLKRSLHFDWTSSILGATFFSANGFIMERIAVGHLGYQPFPLLALFLLLLLDSSINPILAAVCFGLTAGIVLYQAGYFLLIIFGLSILVTLPIIYIIDPSLLSRKRLMTVILLGGFIALLISIAKLTAVYSFMRFFPRINKDELPTQSILGLAGIFAQLLGTMNLRPLVFLAGLDTAAVYRILMYTTGIQFFGYWELDMSMSPVVFGLLLFGILKIFKNFNVFWGKFLDKKRWLAGLFLLTTTWLAIEFSLGRGYIYPYIHNIPILGSLHTSARSTSAFIFPLALIAAYIYRRWMTPQISRKIISTFLVMNVLTLLPLSAFFINEIDLQWRLYDITPSYQIHQSIQDGNIPPVEAIDATASNTEAIQNSVSNLKPYEPIFGYKLEYFHPEISPGSIWNIENGYYNMTNPTGYVYPELNSSRPFERIRIEDKEKLTQFANHKQPDWRIPNYQYILDWVTGLSFTCTIAFLTGYSIKKVLSIFLKHE